MAEDASLLPMGEGRIDHGEVPEELRVVRHNVKQLQTHQILQGEMLRDVVRRQAEVRTIALRAEGQATEAAGAVLVLNRELYGHPDRVGDSGIIGEIRSALKKQAAQNWAILFSIIGLIGVLASSIWLHR